MGKSRKNHIPRVGDFNEVSEDGISPLISALVFFLLYFEEKLAMYEKPPFYQNLERLKHNLYFIIIVLLIPPFISYSSFYLYK